MTQTFFLRVTTTSEDVVGKDQLLNVFLQSRVLPESVRKVELAEIEVVDTAIDITDALTGGSVDERYQ